MSFQTSTQGSKSCALLGSSSFAKRRTHASRWKENQEISHEELMFDSDLDHKNKTHVGRRAFITTSVVTFAGLALWQLRKPRVLEAAAATSLPKEVAVVLFSDAGERLNKTTIARVVKTSDQWRQQLYSQRLRHHPQRRYGNGIYRKILEPSRQRTIPLHLLRQRALRFRHEI